LPDDRAIEPFTLKIPRWLVALLVVALAFGLGYGIRRLAEDDGGAEAVPAGVTFRQASSVKLGTTPAEVLRRFRGTPHVVRNRPEGNLRCLVYVVSDRPDTAWSFCFRSGRLRSSATSPG
jgi:hypothetical protein